MHAVCSRESFCSACSLAYLLTPCGLNHSSGSLAAAVFENTYSFVEEYEIHLKEEAAVISPLEAPLGQVDFTARDVSPLT